MLKIKVKKGANTLDVADNTKYQLVSVIGLNPPIADINVSELATSDGGIFNMARLQKRNIVLQIQPLGNLETRRIELYGFLSPKSAINLDIQTDKRHVTIAGYIENIDIDYNANPQFAQVSIICPDPYFYDYTESVYTNTININNPSEITQGAIFTFNITSSRTSIYMYNYKTSQIFELDNLTLSNGDVVTIDTRAGKKSATLNGSSIMQNVSLYNPESDWIQLAQGSNMFEASPSVISSVRFYPQYLGV